MERYDIRQGEWRAEKAEAGDFVLYADAQATIAALQARVQELEAIKIPDDAFTYCAYCGEKSPVDEHNEDLSAHIKVCPKHPMRDVESQLTQRTAELEAAQQQLSAAQETILRTYTSSAAMDLVGVKAELERVRGEREKYYALIAALPKVEGEINERFCTGSYYSSPHDYRSHVTFETALVALLKHRQGME